jgi:hypothetical protein
MKSVMKWSLIVIGALFLVAIGAAIASPEGREGIERGVEDAQATPTEQPTEQPTVAAIAETAEPTERPTPEPTVEPVAGMFEWIAYSEDRLDWIDNEFLPANDEWDTTGDDPYMTAMGAIPLWSAVLSEQTNLSLVDPHPCFADWHEGWSDVVDTLYEGYDVLTDGGIESDLEKIDRGVTLINEGLEAMDVSTAALEQIDCGQ